MSLLIDNGVKVKSFFVNNFDEVRSLRLISSGYAMNKIKTLEASGEELSYIENRFKNLVVTPDSCIWRGELAKFIYENL